MRRTGVGARRKGTSRSLFSIRAPCFENAMRQPRSIPQAGAFLRHLRMEQDHTSTPQRQDRQCRLALSSSRIVDPASTPGLLPFVDASHLRAAGGAKPPSCCALFYALRVTRVVGPPSSDGLSRLLFLERHSHRRIRREANPL